MTQKKMSGMSVLIRTDASVEIGSGHLMRCLTLADQLAGMGADVAFVCRDLPGGMFDLLQARGYRGVKFSLAEEGDGFQPADAEETIRAARGLFPDGFDWLVVDQYQLDMAWESLLRPHARKLMVIDDLANRPHSCELLLDQNYEDPSRYQGLVPADCKLLLGPAYALLRPEYVANRGSDELRRRSLRTVFVFFGGSDPADLTGKTLQALMAPGLAHLKVDVVVGGSYIRHESLNMLSKERGNTTIHGPQLHLADLMRAADLGVGAGGVTNWERMTLGLPSLVITLAENQVPISEQLHRRGIIRLLGKSDDVYVEHIRDALLDEIRSQKYLDRIAPSMALCDGQGTCRVLHAMQ
jgi:UDP-2,4-diacetamido-2,4,6-trideoxy-beta-L-altropyranose hydrolase